MTPSDIEFIIMILPSACLVAYAAWIRYEDNKRSKANNDE